MKKLILLLALCASSVTAMNVFENLLIGLRNMWESPDQALLAGATAGDFERVQDTLNRGADVNHVDAENLGRTALHRAAQNGHCAIVQFLIDRGANVNHEDQYRWTAREHARRYLQIHVAQLLDQIDAEHARRKLPSRLKGIPTGEK